MGPKDPPCLLAEVRGNLPALGRGHAHYPIGEPGSYEADPVQKNLLLLLEASALARDRRRSRKSPRMSDCWWLRCSLSFILKVASVSLTWSNRASRKQMWLIWIPRAMLQRAFMHSYALLCSCAFSQGGQKIKEAVLLSARDFLSHLQLSKSHWVWKTTWPFRRWMEREMFISRRFNTRSGSMRVGTNEWMTEWMKGVLEIFLAVLAHTSMPSR